MPSSSGGSSSAGDGAPERLQFKLVLLGDAAVGKTALARQLAAPGSFHNTGCVRSVQASHTRVQHPCRQRLPGASGCRCVTNMRRLPSDTQVHGHTGR